MTLATSAASLYQKKRNNSNSKKFWDENMESLAFQDLLQCLLKLAEGRGEELELCILVSVAVSIHSLYLF